MSNDQAEPDIVLPADADVEPRATTTILPPAALSFDDGNSTNNSTKNNNNNHNNKIMLGKSSLVHTHRSFLLVGRQAATCDIRISHKSLSRQHAVLYYRNHANENDDNPSSSSSSSWISRSTLWLVDLGTKSGTFVSGTRVEAKEPIQLTPNDTIQFGKAQPIFTLQWDTPSSTNETAKESSKEEISSVLPLQSQQEEEEEGERADQDEEGPVLTGRAQRQAEIAAMMASLDETPTYTQYTPTDLPPKPQDDSKQSTIISKESRKKQAMLDKYKLPLMSCTTWAFFESESSNASSSAAVSAIAMDPTGSRFAIGSMDSSLRLYDFGGFNAELPTPFQNIYVQEGYPVRSIAYAPSGERYLVATGSAQPRLMDRDGSETLLEFNRGDVYVTDPTKTSGHTAAVTCVQWHPLEKSIVYTTSRDGSLRVWNVDSGKLAFGMLKCQDVIIIKNLKTGRKTIPTCMAITPKFVAMGTECGSLQIYAYPFISKLRPLQSTIVRLDDNDTAVPSSILSVAYSVDGTKLACRTSKAVLIYSVERPNRLSMSSMPLLACTNVGTMDEADNATPTMAFSPNSKVICIAVTEQAQEGGVLRFTNRLDVHAIPKDANDTKRRSPIFSQYLSDLPASDFIVGLSWQGKLNQLLVATNHSFQLWYSEDHSQKGVLLGQHQRRSKRKMEDDLQEMYQARAPPPGSHVRYDEILAPNALPMFGGDSKQKRKQRKLEQQEEDNKRKNPQQPSKSVYNTHNTIFAQMVVDNQTVERKVIAGMDPREALAKYSEGKSYIGKAYEGNKERILADRTVEEEEDEMKKK